MFVKSFCLADAPDARAATSLLQGAARALRAAPEGAPSEVQLLRVLRHIPTDSVAGQSGGSGVVPQADAIGMLVQVCFEGEQAAQACAGSSAWGACLAQLQTAAPVLFSLDSLSNVPIAPRGAAARGGFRRWMLLARQAPTQDQFRDAWFGRHADLVRQLPQVDGYLQHLVIRRYDTGGRLQDYAQLPIDGIAELCFADEAAMTAAYSSPQRLPLRDDGRQLLGRITTILVHGERLA